MRKVEEQRMYSDGNSPSGSAVYGCSFLSKEADATEVSARRKRKVRVPQESETGDSQTETQESHEAAEDEESGKENRGPFREKEDRGGNGYALFCRETGRNRCDSFVGMARGRRRARAGVRLEVMDAFSMI